jgi:soluble P-type ATPase
MIDLEIPGFGRLEITDLVCDYNGTLAVDGILAVDVRERLRTLAGRLRCHVVTADTFGTARAAVADLDCRLVVLPERDQAESKRRYVDSLGARHVAAIGNGRNDRLMLAAAALGVGVCGGEGIAVEALQAGAIVVHDVRDALDLLLNPGRLTATLRS